MIEFLTPNQDRWGPSDRTVEIAWQIASAAAGTLGFAADPVAAGSRPFSDEHAPTWRTLADGEGNEVDVATTRGRDWPPQP